MARLKEGLANYRSCRSDILLIHLVRDKTLVIIWMICSFEFVRPTDSLTLTMMCWRDAIAKEMKDVDVAFQHLEDREADPVRHQKTTVQLVFNVKMGLLHRKQHTQSVKGTRLMIPTPSPMQALCLVNMFAWRRAGPCCSQRTRRPKC